MDDRPNIILVVFDTLRWDYFQQLMSVDKEFAEVMSSFINFNNAYSPSSWTLPSHMSLFTGLYPSEHKVHENPNSEISEVFDLATKYKGNFLTSFASANGYKTIGISANLMISGLTGLDQRFDDFYNIDTGRLSGLNRNIYHGKLIRKIESANSILISHLRGFPGNKGYKTICTLINKMDLSHPFFLFANFMEMHDPYFKLHGLHGDDNKKILKDVFGLRSLNNNYMEGVKNRYYNQLLKVKFTVLNIINILKRKEKYENTVIIFTSDHGQALKEHGYYGHGIFLFDELTHIPLLIKQAKCCTTMLNSISYVNLVDVYNYLINIINKHNTERSLKGNDYTFSEAFGMQYSKQVVEKFLKNNEGRNIYNKLNLPRKMIVKNGYKLCINSNSEVEEFSYMGKEKNPISQDQVIDDLLLHLKIFNITGGFKISIDDFHKSMR